jgi:hypothetical protein
MIDVTIDANNVMPTLKECDGEYDDTEVSVPFSSIAFSSSVAHGRDLSRFSVINSACSKNLTAFRSDFGTFDPPSITSRVGGVRLDLKSSGTVRIIILLVSGMSFRRIVHALCTLDLSSRSAQRIGRLRNVNWMQTHAGCKFVFPTDCGTGPLTVPT